MARQSLTEAKRFSIVPSGNFSNPTILSPPPSVVFPREPRAISFPYIAYTTLPLPLTSLRAGFLVQPPPSGIAPLRPPFEAGRLRGETARGVGVVPGASHQRRRPTDRPSRPSVLLSARPVSSREPSRGLIHSCSYTKRTTQTTHRATHHVVLCLPLSWPPPVVVHSGGARLNSPLGSDEKNGAYAEPDRSRNKRTLDGRRRGVISHCKSNISG